MLGFPSGSLTFSNERLGRLGGKKMVSKQTLLCWFSSLPSGSILSGSVFIGLHQQSRSWRFTDKNFNSLDSYHQGLYRSVCMYNYTNNQHINLPDEYSITLRNHRVTKGRKSVFAAGCLRYKNKRLLWYQNRWQSLSLLIFGKLAVPATPRRNRSSPTQSAHQFGKPSAMPRDAVNLWNTRFLIFTCLTFELNYTH